METVIEARGLTKRYRRVPALAGLDLVACHGRVAAVLGPNGAGKTTFMRALATLVRPDSGSLRIAGLDVLRQPADVRRIIGLAGQYAAVEEAMTGRENLQMIGHLFGLRRRAARAAAAKVLAQLGLAGDADRLVRTYSGGMRRKLDLGASLVGSPRLLLLDEPTTGLDPRSRIELWEAIGSLVATGTDVLLTTQYLDEADHLAADIVIIDHGRAIASGTPGELKSRAGHDMIEVHPRDRADMAQITEALSRFDPRPRIDAAAGTVAIAVDQGTARMVDVARRLDDLGLLVEDLALRRPTLDEVFLNLTGRPLDPETAGQAQLTTIPEKGQLP
jgi:ABC-2 type transport system ATP-binding protein